ncbi:MAG: hypothetical protein ACOCRZ_03750 [Halothermotrichaceae bacterium]
MWQVVYIAAKEKAQALKSRLEEQGIMVQLDRLDNSNYQIKVLTSEVEDAYNIVNEDLLK